MWSAPDRDRHARVGRIARPSGLGQQARLANPGNQTGASDHERKRSGLNARDDNHTPPDPAAFNAAVADTPANGFGRSRQPRSLIGGLTSGLAAAQPLG